MHRNSVIFRHENKGIDLTIEMNMVRIMPNQSLELSRVFRALSDPTRRAVLERLGVGSAPVSALAEPFSMALPSLLQHLDVLQESGLVRSHKQGRVRTYEIAPATMQAAEDWMASQRTRWERRLAQLDAYLYEAKEPEL
jgi:DNA-binding transcriptional ArsR family regulator